MIFFLQHIDIEGPETIGAFLENKGHPVKVVHLYQGEALPESLESIEAVVSLGGPMNVYEEGAYPFLKEEHRFLQKVLEKQVPFLGICLGSQLLAKAAAAKVRRSPHKEIGFMEVSLTPAGMSDPLFAGCPKDLYVYQWHEDMAEVSHEGVLLARSAGCPTQAFRLGSKAYGLQFHVEITDKSIRDWSDRYFKEPAVLKEQKARMLDDYVQHKEKFHRLAEKIYNNFLTILSC